MQGEFRRTNTPPATPVPNYPVIYTLHVQLAAGNFASFHEIAADLDPESLKRYLQVWLAQPNNRQNYLGRFDIRPVPFVGKL